VIKTPQDTVAGLCYELDRACKVLFQVVLLICHNGDFLTRDIQPKSDPMGGHRGWRCSRTPAIWIGPYIFLFSTIEGWIVSYIKIFTLLHNFMYLLS
jgi:hypothetical protein